MHVPATPLFSGIYTDFSVAIFHSGDILRARPRRSHLPPQGILHALIVIEILSPGHGVGGSFRHPRDATLVPTDRHRTIRLTSSSNPVTGVTLNKLSWSDGSRRR